ncbi:hydrolase [Bizionia argentinensis JUB59]|uniref:Hydrolase n=2 Tax=Bizionia TaxID=283785 RepID=G2E9Q8_9FLAO|nr:hydrolase [Bizionia argentinensis JUB59]
MYLFIFSMLLVVFQYVNSKRILESYEEKIVKKEAHRVRDGVKFTDSISDMRDEISKLSEFSVMNTESALSYFEEKGYSVSELIPFIKDQLYELNLVKGDEHPLIPFPALNGGKMMIDQIRVLNHKWIITNFTDGKYWGEMFLSYELSEDKKLTFKVEKSFLYPFN